VYRTSLSHIRRRLVHAQKLISYISSLDFSLYRIPYLAESRTSSVLPVMASEASVRDYGLAVPHGPNTTGHHVATADFGDMSVNEAGVFQSLLKPDDSYDENGVYWGDMGLIQRAKFVSKVDAAESKKELSSIWSMIKKDPLSPVGYYARNMVIPGAGLLLEG